MFIDYRASQFTGLTKQRNDGGCRHSRSAPVLRLRCRLNKKILVLFFLSLGMVASISALAFRRLSFVGFIAILDLWLRYALALLFYLCMLSSHSKRTVSSQLLSCALAQASLWIQLWWACVWPPPLFWQNEA
jgi:hypothetical protein